MIPAKAGGGTGEGEYNEAAHRYLPYVGACLLLTLGLHRNTAPQMQRPGAPQSR